MIRRNEILRIEGENFRVVQIFGDLAMLIRMKGQSVELIRMDAQRLDEEVKAGTVTVELDKWSDIEHREFPESMINTGKEAYELIRAIVSNPEIYVEHGLRRVLREAAKGDRMIERRLGLLVGIYWRRGQVWQSLIPDYVRNTGHVEGGRKRGRRAADGRETGAALTPEWLGRMEVICQKYLLGEEKATLQEAYDAFVRDARTALEAGELKIEVNEGEESAENESAGIPSFHQFYYFHRTRHGKKRVKKEEKIAENEKTGDEMEMGE
ncbi:hypothetical protein [Sutterella sp.]|uniref:hypothetical protein n=1 Tax=Sutterella sp. TaxID=1981025 RepID=UPI0026DFAED5|nr:hypothetical protein [Sutterella sp.]MDO5532561.1 hypothetical protein [Sutterella sp.]